MTQHLLLGMYAPLALVLGAPATLPLAALPVRARPRVAAVLRSRPLHALSHPATAAVLTVGALYLLYLAPLYTLSARSALVHQPLHVHFLLTGYLFAWAVAGPDPALRRPGTGLRIAEVVAAGGAQSSLAELLYSRASHHHPAAATARPRWNWPASGCTTAGTWPA
jgi:putative membrane protein